MLAGAFAGIAVRAISSTTNEPFYGFQVVMLMPLAGTLRHVSHRLAQGEQSPKISGLYHQLLI